MLKVLYTVVAYRFGDRERHSYLVGVFEKKQKALVEAEKEEEYRGGKYICEICEIELNFSIAGNHNPIGKMVKSLPASRPTL